MPRIYNKIHFVLAVLVSLASLFIPSGNAGATDATSFPAERYGYFTDGHVSSDGSGGFVLTDIVTDRSDDAVPVCINSKAELISYIRALVNSAGSFICDGGAKGISYGSKKTNNRIGAAYIVQTMRSNGSSFDRNMPDAADLNEWEEIVNSYPGSIHWNMSKADAGVSSSTPNTFYGNASGTKDIGWYPHSGSSSPNGVIVFKDTNGTIQYMIKRNCGNPMGSISGGLQRSWSLSGVTSADKTTVVSGDPIVFSSSITNSSSGGAASFAFGPRYFYAFNDHTGESSLSSWSSATEYPTTNATALPWSYKKPGAAGSTSVTGARNVSGFSLSSGQSITAMRLSVTANPPGSQKYICGVAAFSPYNYSGAANGRSRVVCALIVPRYDLTPSADVAASSVVPGGTVSGVSGSVNNSASIQTPEQSQAAVVRFVLPGGVGTLTTTSAGDTTLSNNTNYPCKLVGYVANGETNCSALVESPARFFAAGDSSLYNGSDNLSSVALQFGDRVCYMTVVNNFTNSSSATDWRYSAPACIPVNKIPNVQVVGNDARVGSGYSVATGRNASRVSGLSQLSSDDGRYYGSWSEYGAIAPSTISGFASGAAFSKGTPSLVQSDWSKLTFANKLSYGQFVTDPANLGTIPSVAAHLDDFSFDRIQTTNTINSWPAGRTTVLIQNLGGTVTITGNINKPASYTDVSNMPQMIIIANDIVINSGVTHIDAWLVATNSIKTCNVAVGVRLTATQCDQQLRINGPVMANKLFLFRTYGADSPSRLDEPAEVINLPADTYMWVRYQSELAGGLRATYSRELPPRY